MTKIVCILILFLTIKLTAQNHNNDKKWLVGVNVSATLFRGEVGSKVNDRFNTQLPALQLSKYLGNQFSFDFIITHQIINPLGNIGGGNTFKYTSADAYIRYDLPKIFLNIIPFAGVGFGYVKGASSVPNPEDAFSLDFMGGGTIWMTDRLGLSGRVIYKSISSNAVAMGSHAQVFGGLVYRFNFNAGSGQGRKRIWNSRH